MISLAKPKKLTGFRRFSRLSACQVPHQSAHAVGPRRGQVAGGDAVEQGAQLRRGNGHGVAHHVGKALAGAVAVLGGGEHGAQEKHHAVGVLVVGAHGLRGQVQGVAADLADGTGAHEGR